MKLAMYEGKPVVIHDRHGDMQNLTAAPIPSYKDVAAINADWQIFAQWQEQIPDDAYSITVDPEKLSAPITNPKQIFGVGLNYPKHSDEIHLAPAKVPNIFGKFVSSLTGPNAKIKLQTPTTDWETELVVVIGQGGRHIAAETAAEHIFGYTIGEDLTDRAMQFANEGSSQWSLSKSFEQYSPIGPYLVTPDEISDLGNKHIATLLNGETKQNAKLADMTFSVAELIANISDVVELFPGDLIFTGSPAGVGYGAKPPVYLKPGDQLVSEIAGFGKITSTFE